MNRYLYITRPQPDANHDRRMLSHLDCKIWIEPLLTIEPYAHPTTPPAYEALIATSANAVRLFKNSNKSTPLYTIGSTTKAAAQTEGYNNIISANGKAADLATLINNIVPKNSKLHFIRGQYIAFPLKEKLEEKGYSLSESILYTTTPTKTFTPSLIQHIHNGNIAAITLYSKRTANILVNLLTQNNLISSLKNTKLLSISPSVIQYVHSHIQDQNWKGAYSAAQANREGMLSLIEHHMYNAKK